MKPLIKDPLLNGLIGTIVDSAIIIDASGIIVTVNQPCIELFGYGKESLTGSNVSLLMPEPDRSAHDGYLRNFHETGQAKIIGIGRDVQGRKRDGTVFPMNLAVGQMTYDDQPYFIGIIRDLTLSQARMKAYEELQDRHFHLSRVAAMNEMGAAIAHEVNQPLAAAANYTETARILLDRLDTAALSEAGQTTRKKIDDMLIKSSDQNKRASEIIARMRRFIERRDAEIRPFDLEETIRESLLLGLTGFTDGVIETTLVCDTKLPRALADPIQVQQVLVNLIRNAADAMRTTAEKRLTIKAVMDDETSNMIRIDIRDSGIGVPPDMQSSLFSAFISSKDDGMGVGLSISRSIIDAMQGRIWATPNPDAGMTFSLTLPAETKA